MRETMKELSKCLCCDERHLEPILDLNNQPLANSYLPSPETPEDTFPLQLNFCNRCTHLQLSHAVHPDFLFKHYLYVSGTSETLLKYFEDFVGLTKQYVETPSNVLDIACNDGSQLNYFKKAGCNTYGIDPAKNLHALSSIDHNVICDYLSSETINSFGVHFDIILAQNVFAHNDYPKQFLEYCKQVITDKGCIFIQTSQANMVSNNEFDTIYHEHLSYFSVKSLCTLARRCGLNVLDVRRTPIHGTSFVFVLSEQGVDRSDYFIGLESELNPSILSGYVTKCRKVVIDLKDAIDLYKNRGFRIIGYGAAAKGNTLLNFGNITLDYIIDDNSLKQGLYTPGMHIPIKPSEALLQETQPIVIIPLAWNFYEEIKSRALQKIERATFIRYFPSILIESQ